jgi:multidrug resistance efflux pump
MNRIHRMIRHLLRSALISIAVATGVLNVVPGLHAQVQRQSGSTVSAQVDPNAVRAVVDPLKAEVAALRAEVNRLHAALESLRLTVQANHAEYAKHRHGVTSYGVVSAKMISHEAPADVLLAFTAPGTQTKAFSGPPE